MSPARAIGSALLAIACVACAPRQTEVVASVDAEAGVLSAATSIRVRVRGGSLGDATWTEVFEQTYSLARTPLPIVVAMTPQGGRDDRRYEIVAEALAPDDSVVARVRAIGGYARGEVRLLELVLETACLGTIDCGEDETCTAGHCAPALVDVASLRRITDPSEVPVPRVDGGVPDADVDAPTCSPAPDDPNNCGACGNRCAWGSCQDGTCVRPQIAAGRVSTCARLPDLVFCWGDGQYGQIGDGTTDPATLPRAAMVVDATDVALGGDTGCAVIGTGVVCWGHNDHGQLGDGTTMDTATPGTVPSLTGVFELAVGGAHACAYSGLSLACWGANDHLQLGSAIADDFPMPIEESISDVTQVVAGGAHTCVLQGGVVSCRGSNQRLQSGWVGATDSQSFARVDAISDAIQIAAGDEHTCAVTMDGSVACWGSNISGRLGGPTVDANSSTPVSFDLPGPAAQVVAGRAHTCARTLDGEVYCWGLDTSGQLGEGASEQSGNAHQRVVGIDDAIDLAAGGDHTCVVRARTGAVWCWGSGSQGELGNGDVASSPIPVEVVVPTP